MKPLVVIILLFINSGFLSNTLWKDELNWKADRKLEWSDFKDQPQQNASLMARINWNITYKYKLKSSGITFTVRCFIDRNKSWVKENAKTAMVLEHQQLHFDIAELYARKLRKRFDEYTFDKKKFDEKIKMIFQEVLTACKHTQEEYEKETEQGRNRSAQERWNQEINSELEKLKDFSS